MINGKKSLFYTVLMAGALMSCGGPKQAPSEEVAKSGNPVFEGWYADPEGIIYGDTYWIYPTTSDLYEKQTFFDCFSSKDLVNWTKHTAILDTAEVKWAKIAMWAPSVINKDGKYYLFFGANDVHEGEIGGIGVAVSDRPEGPYKDLLGKPLINEIVNGAQPIDQFVFHDLILILAQARDLKAGKKRGDLIAIQRQLRHVALIACLTAYRKLGKPSLAHITQAITFRLIDQTHLMNLRIIRPRPLVTLGDRDRFLSANPSGITQQAN